jgi:hypothetical protein
MGVFIYFVDFFFFLREKESREISFGVLHFEFVNAFVFCWGAGGRKPIQKGIAKRTRILTNRWTGFMNIEK